MHSCYDKCALCEYFTSFTCHYLHILPYKLCIFHITLFTYSSIVFTYFTLYIYKCATLMYFLSFFLVMQTFDWQILSCNIFSVAGTTSRNSFGKSSQQQNGMGICCNLAKIFLPTPSHLVYIEKLVINVSSSCSTYCRNDDDGTSSPPKFLANFL